MREIQVPLSQRYERSGGAAPESPKKKGKEKEKKEKGKATPDPDASSVEENVPLFPPHCVTSFQLTGVFGIAKKA